MLPWTGARPSAAHRSIPASAPPGASPLCRSRKRSCSWLVYRKPLPKNAFQTAAPFVRAFAPGGTAMKSADFRRPMRPDHFSLGPDSRTSGWPPGTSLSAFGARATVWNSSSRVDWRGTVCPVSRIQFLSIGSRPGSTLALGPAPGRCPGSLPGHGLNQAREGFHPRAARQERKRGSGSLRSPV